MLIYAVSFFAVSLLGISYRLQAKSDVFPSSPTMIYRTEGANLIAVLNSKGREKREEREREERDLFDFG
jgi:hypothetical protein